MTTPDDISWGNYQKYEGPFFRGKAGFDLAEIDTARIKCDKRALDPRYLAVITATEGGRYDAINMYDRCIVSVGLIQWCEAGQYSVSDLLGGVAERSRDLLKPLEPALSASGVEFKKNARGKYRFFFSDERGEVDSIPKQQALYLGGITGLKGTWDDRTKAHARLWAACLANVLAQPDAKAVQVEFTLPRIQGFAMPDAKKVLFGDDAENEGWVGAMRAGYLSFAANLPAVAGTQLKEALVDAPSPQWSRDWCVHVFRKLTFGPEISIYPHRYKAIRPVLERLFGVDLPDLVGEHEAAKGGGDAKSAGVAEGSGDLSAPEAIQRELIAQGYDLGPGGADGSMGPRTKAALMEFQRSHGLDPDGLVGAKTRAALVEQAKKRGAGG